MFRRKVKNQTTSEAVEQPVAKALLPTEAIISLGGWYPRTNLHLQEVYNFLSHKLDYGRYGDDLKSLHQELGLISVAKQVGYLEYVRVVTVQGIEIRYYEDGLYILDISSHDPHQAQQALSEYHRSVWQPAMEKLFAKGAPLPEKAHYFGSGSAIVALHWPHPNRFEPDPQFGPIVSKVSSDDVAVFKLAELCLLVYAQPGSAQVRDLLEMQLFFEQFQSHLDYSLQDYRQVWSDTAVMAERAHLKSGQLDKAKSAVFQLQKQVVLAEGRLQQSIMALQTRSDIAQQLELDQYLIQLFHYRFEVLEDGLRYVEHSWRMAGQYLEQTDRFLDSLAGRHTRLVNKWIMSLLLLLSVSSLAGWLIKGQIIAVEHGNFVALVGVLLVGLGLLWFVGGVLVQQNFLIKHRRSDTSGKASAKVRK